MHPLDWTLFLGFLAFTIWDGVRQSAKHRGAEDYFLAGRAVPWWAAGLSIMATQASAITLVGTTGQGWAEGLRFLQFYFALPLAMVLLAIYAVPAYHRLRVSTAYEYLGLRFDAKTRVLSALLFLVLRCLSVAFVIYTPSLVLSRVFGLPLGGTILAMGGTALVYTSVGGLGAVISTDVKQMTVMIVGLVAAAIVLALRLDDLVGLPGAFAIAEQAGRVELVDWSWNPAERYTIWSSLLGGLFLFLSYFGTDQSQAQRLLASRSIRDARGALLLNAVAKLPFQLLVLAIGVGLFAYYTVTGAPLGFEPSADDPSAVPGGARPRYAEIEVEYASVRSDLSRAARELAGGAGSEEYGALLARSTELREEARAIRGGPVDTNYVFLDFVLAELPIGVIGLLLAAIFAAALSSIDSEFNSMATVAVLDVFRRGGASGIGTGASPSAEGGPMSAPATLWGARLATLLLGTLATAFALSMDVTGSLVEAVNRVGSYVYGSLLGAFVLALAVPWANGTGAFIGILTGMAVVAVAAQTNLAFLYLNTVGTVAVVVVGMVLSALTGGRPTRDSRRGSMRHRPDGGMT